MSKITLKFPAHSRCYGESLAAAVVRKIGLDAEYDGGTVRIEPADGMNATECVNRIRKIQRDLMRRERGNK